MNHRLKMTVGFCFLFLSFQWNCFAKDFKIGLVLDRGGKQDRGFNAHALEGFEQAKSSFGFQGEILEAKGDSDHEALLRDFAKRKFNLVIALGEARGDAVKKVAAEFPSVNFAVVDGKVQAPNVRSILFKEEEGSYLIGAIASLFTKTKTLGFIGGIDIPVIRRFRIGFEAGAEEIRPDIKILVNYVGNDGQAWNNPASAKSLAVGQYLAGADIIFAVSGKSNFGIFEAAEEKNKLAIGSSNQHWPRPEHVLTSLEKMVQIGVLMACQDAFLGGFTSETKRYGLSDQAMNYIIDSNHEKLFTPSIRKQVEQLKSEIIEGKTTIPGASDSSF